MSRAPRSILLTVTAMLANTVSADPPGSPAEHVDQGRLMTSLRSLPTQRCARGDAAHIEGLIETERLLVERLTALGYEPVLQDLPWTIRREAASRKQEIAPDREPFADHTWHNIIVDLPGRDLAAETLVLGAHFDAVDGTPGADDNGTGTAALLEIAAVLKDRPMRRTVRMIFFNHEEFGYFGAIHYVRQLKPRLDAGEEKVIGMVSLEMLGYFTDEPGSQRSPIPAIEGVFEPPTVGDFIAIASTRGHADFIHRLDQEMRRAAPGLKVVAPDFIPDLPLAPPDLLRSDHTPFLFVGIPAVMLTDTSNFRNPNYHRPTDTVETLDEARFAQVVRAVAGAAYAIAEPAADQPAPE